MQESILQMWCRREFQRSGATQLKALKPSVVGWAGGIMGLIEQQDLRIQKGVMMCRRSERVGEVGNSADSLAPHRVGINRLPCVCVCGFDFTVNKLIWKQTFRFHVLLFDLTRSDGSCSLFEFLVFSKTAPNLLFDPTDLWDVKKSYLSTTHYEL